ncbi:Maspardin-like protein [Dinothrombium tinctorium]|uniref:Maspardin n=1 Tax=Dinothrombium tinctorium TaxID=1965070 RepID=A0A3S3SBW6_9ACAR|nr:Maspardin-like protein [Dinothrombium tinctorium]
MEKVLNFFGGSKREYYKSLSESEEYQRFRSNVPQRKIVVDEDSAKVWTLYDSGPREVCSPLLCFPPVSGTADCFYLQLSRLAAKGCRVIAVQYPTYWTLREFVHGLIKLLDTLRLDKVHIFGASLGGFLAQKFAETTTMCPRVQSLILCNSFADTAIFNHSDSAVLFWAMPAIFLRKLVLVSTGLSVRDKAIHDAEEFMSERLESLSQQELASRLTLNCINCYVEPQRLQSIPITIIDVFDRCAISESVCEELYKLYPHAKRAHLKSGGNFPYISRADEVNMHILIHLRQFESTRYSAFGKV